MGGLAGCKVITEAGLHVPLVVRVLKSFNTWLDLSREAGSGFVSFIDFGPTLESRRVAHTRRGRWTSFGSECRTRSRPARYLIWVC